MKICFKSCFFIVPILFSECLADEADDFHLSYINGLKDKYQYETWSGIIKTNYIKLITKWEPDFSTYGATNLLSQPSISTNPNFYWGMYLFQPTNLSCNVHLRFIEASNVLNAHEALIEHFGGCTATQPFPTGASIGVNIGDHCYTGYPIGSTNSIFFCKK